MTRISRGPFLALGAVAFIASLPLLYILPEASFLFPTFENIPSLVDNSALTSSAPQDGLCHTNQYIPSIKSSLADISHRMDKWLVNETFFDQTLRADGDIIKNKAIREKHMSLRFQAFEEMAQCDKTCVGGPCSADQSKQVCGLSLLKAPCVVYSIGGNNQWSFENAVLKDTPCEVHTFDCTGPKSRFQAPKHERHHFHYVCLGPENKPALTEDEKRKAKAPKGNIAKLPMGEFWTMDKIQTTLNHSQIDLLKMDIEGYEWPIFAQWPLLNKTLTRVLPMQVLVEIHYRDRQPGFDTGVVALQSRLLRMGYATIINDPNPRCSHCVELTLMRIKC